MTTRKWHDEEKESDFTLCMEHARARKGAGQKILVIFGSKSSDGCEDCIAIAAYEFLSHAESPKWIIDMH